MTLSLDDDIQHYMDHYDSEMHASLYALNDFWRQQISPDGTIEGDAIPRVVGAAMLTGGIITARLVILTMNTAIQCTLHEMGLHDAEDIVENVANATIESLTEGVAKRVIANHLGNERPSDN